MHSHLLQDECELRHLPQELAVGDGAALVRLVGLVDDGGLVGVPEGVPVDAVVRGIEAPLEEPGVVAMLEGARTDGLEVALPREQISCESRPEDVGLSDALLVQLRVLVDSRQVRLSGRSVEDSLGRWVCLCATVSRPALMPCARAGASGRDVPASCASGMAEPTGWPSAADMMLELDGGATGAVRLVATKNLSGSRGFFQFTGLVGCLHHGTAKAKAEQCGEAPMPRSGQAGSSGLGMRDEGGDGDSMVWLHPSGLLMTPPARVELQAAWQGDVDGDADGDDSRVTERLGRGRSEMWGSPLYVSSPDQ